jgi:hypothetical protein
MAEAAGVRSRHAHSDPQERVVCLLRALTPGVAELSVLYRGQGQTELVKRVSLLQDRRPKGDTARR